MYEASAGLFPITSNTTGISYDINFSSLILNNIPKRRRRSVFFSYMEAIFSQIKYSYDRFLEFRNQSLFNANITSQRIVLEKFLRLNYNNNGIRILNASFLFQNTYLYNKAEIGNAVNQKKTLRNKNEGTNGHQIYLFNRAESILTFDFKVEIPIALIQAGVTTQEISALIDKYKMMGTIYEIVIIA